MANKIVALGKNSTTGSFIPLAVNDSGAIESDNMLSGESNGVISPVNESLYYEKTLDLDFHPALLTWVEKLDCQNYNELYFQLYLETKGGVGNLDIKIYNTIVDANFPTLGGNNTGLIASLSNNVINLNNDYIYTIKIGKGLTPSASNEMVVYNDILPPQITVSIDSDVTRKYAARLLLMRR